MAGFVDNVFEQTFKRHPYLFLFVIFCSGSVVAYAHQTFAEDSSVQAKFEQLDRRITGVNSKLDKRFSQQRLHSLESEIYVLEGVIASGDATSRDHQRLVKLRNERGDVRRQLKD